MTSTKSRMNGGFTMVELVIACAIILSAVVALIGVHGLYLKSALSNSGTLKAAYLAEEGIEAMRYLRDDSWSTKIEPLSNGTMYGVSISGGVWQISSSTDWIDGFARSIVLANVNRDTNDDIATVGGTLDPDTKLVTVSVSWLSRGATTTKSISTYLTDISNN